METNFPAAVRQAIYVTVVLVTAVVVPLNAVGMLADWVILVWNSVAGAASLLASLNVNKITD
jgi:hypothetical protein